MVLWIQLFKSDPSFKTKQWEKKKCLWKLVSAKINNINSQFWEYINIYIYIIYILDYLSCLALWILFAVFWPRFTNKACTWIHTSHVSSASLQNTRPHEDPGAFLTDPGQVLTHSISCLTCVKEVYPLRSTPLNFVCYLTRYLLMRLY